MNSESQAIAQDFYQQGRQAFESGQYRQSVAHLEKATALVPRGSALGREASVWLVTAYDAAGECDRAISLCRELARHPHPETSKQAKRLLYILEAPKLKKRPECLVEVPDFANLQKNDAKWRQAIEATPARQGRSRDRSEEEPIAPTDANDRDNHFVWIAAIALALVLGAMAYWT